MKRVQLFIPLFFMALQVTFAQQNYNDFEGNKWLHFGPKNGMLDSMVTNPAPDKVNNSAHCAKYKRANVKYDNVKVFTLRKLVDASPYATYLGNPPKFTMKIFTSAPIGTKIELQLGKKGDDSYPAGVHSQYEVVTKTQNQWEELSFVFSQIPKGSLVEATEIDKITILFAPNTMSTDTYYFDDLTGPSLVTGSTSQAIK